MSESIFNSVSIGLTLVNITAAPSSSSSSPIFDSFCEHLKIIGGTYNLAHGYASLIVCCFGILANILNLIILTRKEMVNSTNVILTGLALADLLTTVEYVPYAIYTDFLPDLLNGGRRKTYPWALYVLIHSNFSQVCHTIAIWLTVTVAVWRYFMISTPLQCKTLCSMQRARWILLSAYVISPLLCVPIYLAFSIRTVAPTDPGIEPPNVAVILHHFSENITIPTTLPGELQYIVDLSDLARSNKIIVTINFWVCSVVIKIIPCILLTVVSLRLICSLMKVNERKKMLLLGLPSSSRHANTRNSNRRMKTKDSLQPHHSRTEPSTLAASADQVSAVSMSATASPQLIIQQKNSHQETHSLQESVDQIAETSLTIAILPENEVSRPVSVSGNSGRCTTSGEICLTKRTTTMLLTVLILFLITEFPQGILALFSDLMGDDFFKRCYIPMANLMDFLALFNAALNFILYFATSIRFRNTFMRLLKRTRS